MSQSHLQIIAVVKTKQCHSMIFAVKMTLPNVLRCCRKAGHALITLVISSNKDKFEIQSRRVYKVSTNEEWPCTLGQWTHWLIKMSFETLNEC